MELQEAHLLPNELKEMEGKKVEYFDLARYSSMSEAAFIKKREPLIEQWDKWKMLDGCYFADDIPGESLRERDYWRAVYAQILHNTACECLGTRPDDQRYAYTNPDAVNNIMGVVERAQTAQGWSLAEATTPTKTTAWSGATNLPIVLGYVRKIMPRMFSLNLVQVQPMDKPTGRYFSITRNRHNDGSGAGDLAARAGWSYRSWAMTPGEATTIAKSITFTMTSDNVTAVNRKLKTETSIEVEQDLRAYHGMDVVDLLADGAVDELANELDEEILYQIYIDTQLNGGTFQLGAMPASGWAHEEWDRKILELVQRAAEHVETNKRVQPNKLVFGSDWNVRMGNLGHWVPTDQLVGPNAFVRPVGTLASTWDCYKATLPWPTTEGVLMYKGSTWTDASFIFLPYVPVMLAGSHFDPDNQVRTLSWISRYAIVSVDSAQGAFLKIDETNITGTSYAAFSEYTG
jgi:hypothetical protein